MMIRMQNVDIIIFHYFYTPDLIAAKSIKIDE